MKILSFLVLMALALMGVSCGDKNASGSGGARNSNSTFASDPYRVQTVIGLVNVDTLMIQIDNQVYQASQNTLPIVMNALNVSYKQNIQPNGARMLKARMTASVESAPTQNAYQGGYQSGYTQPAPQQRSNFLNIQSMVIYP